MLSDNDKYYLIHQHLKGKLSETEASALEQALAQHPGMKQEIEMHQLANELVLDHQLLKVRELARKTIAQKESRNNWGKWGLFAALLYVGGATLYVLLPTPKVITHAPHLQPQVVVAQKPGASPSPTKMPLLPLLPQHPVVASSTPSTLIQPNQTITTTTPNEVLIPTQPNQTTYETASLPSAIPSIANNEITVIAKGVPDIKAGTIVTDTPPSNSLLASKPLETIELILNPLRSEQIQLPFDESDFSGQFEVFGSDGQPLVQATIVNGYPNQWDGTLRGGAQASSGHMVLYSNPHLGNWLNKDI